MTTKFFTGSPLAALWDGLPSLWRRQCARKAISVVLGLLFCFLASATIIGQENDALKKADALDWDGEYRQEKDFLLEVAVKTTNAKMLAEIYWRAARATFSAADTEYRQGRISKSEAMGMYEEGEGYANRAIEQDGQNASGYFWKATNICLWGQIGGGLASLSRMESVESNLRTALRYEPESAEAYFVLGQIYEKAPGWPISLGNVEYAVSVGRKSIDLMETLIDSGRMRGRVYSFDIALASHLWTRNWDVPKRAGKGTEQRRQFEKRHDIYEKNLFFEGTVSIPNISDRDEARQIIAVVIGELEKLPHRTINQQNEFEKAREFVVKIGKKE
jgi:tetratricopeptide (TPR) repeat protein